MQTTTFRLAKAAGACVEGYREYAHHVGGVGKYGRDTPINLTDILDHNGISDALWCLGCCLDQPSAVKVSCVLAADFAEHVLRFFEERYPEDKRPRRAIDAYRLFARGEITAAAWAAAGDAARAAAGDAAGDAETEWQRRRLKEVLIT